MLRHLRGYNIHWRECQVFSVPLPLGIRSHSTRLKVISLLSFSIMKILVLLCEAVTTCFLNGALLTICQPLCLLAVHPSLGACSLLTWISAAYPTVPRVGICRRHLKKRQWRLFPGKQCSLRWTQGGFLLVSHHILLSQVSIKWIQILPWES